MFSAHLIFGDIDGHSQYDFEDRVKILKEFWKICEAHKPKNIDENPHSFYDIDNDSIMIGMSDLQGYQSGESILKWTIKLQSELSKNKINVTFGINLLSCKQPLNWETNPGFINNPRQLHIDDLIMEKYGRIQRSKLAGDALIVVARLLEIAKMNKSPIVFSVFQDDNFLNDIDDIINVIGEGKLILKKINGNNTKLKKEKEDFLKERNVIAFSISYS